MELTSHPAGAFCSPEFDTRDMDGSKRFRADRVPEIGRFARLADTSDAPLGVFQPPRRS